MAKTLRITSVPAGEAPLWVRQCWVGLSLPLVLQRDAPMSFLTSGVLSAPKGFLAFLAALFTGKLARNRGFAVDANAAVAVLATAHPKAAEWWRANAPHLLQGRKYFVFREDCGHVVES